VVVIVVVVVVVVVLVDVLVIVVDMVGVLSVLCGRGWCDWWLLVVWLGCMVTDGSEVPLGIVRSAQWASQYQAHVSKHVA